MILRRIQTAKKEKQLEECQKEGNAYVFYTKYLHGDKDRFRGSLKKGILKKGWEGGERGL